MKTLFEIILIQGLLLINTLGEDNVTLYVNEDEPVGHIIGEINRDPDANYALTDTKYFKLDDNFKNRILVKNPLDRDNDRDLCNGNVGPDDCSWTGIVVKDETKFIKVRIVVNDVNDNAPSWSNREEDNIIRVPILESSPVGQTFDLPTAVDPDSGENSIVSYDLVRDIGYDSKFSVMTVQKKSGLVPQLIINKVLDYEEKSEYNLTLSATDGPGRVGTASLLINIIDENDNKPEFEHTKDPFVIEVNEDLKINSKLSKHPVAKDKDSGRLGAVRYKFSLATKENVRRDFSLDPNTGDIIVRSKLDYDVGSNKEYSMTIIAEDGGNPALSSETQVSILLQDVNDNKPNIKLTPNELTIEEEIEPEKLIATIMVDDIDSGKNGEFSCSLRSGDNFRLQRHSEKIGKITVYQLLTRKKFDREVEAVIRDTLVCTDNGDRPQIAEKYLQMNMIDINDSPPKFNTKNFSFQFEEGNDPDAVVGRVRAMDKDVSPNNIIIYDLIWPDKLGPQVFRVDEEGNIIATRKINRESNPEGYYFQITARDPKKKEFNDSAYVEIALKDINNCRPKFIQPTYNFSVEENDGDEDQRSPSTARGYRREVGRVMATDDDLGSNAEIEYSIPSQNVPFNIDNQGNIYITSHIDREETPAFLITIEAKDLPRLPNGQIDKSRQLTSQIKVNIAINDLNDNPPRFINPPELIGNQRSSLDSPDLRSPSEVAGNLIRMSYMEEIGFQVFHVEAIDPDNGENRRVTYYIYRQSPAQPLFHIDENNGNLVLSRKLTISDLGPKKLFLMAKDHGTPMRKSYNELVVNVTDDQPIGEGAIKLNYGSFRSNKFFTSFFTRDKLIIVAIASATIIISTALIMIVCLVFRGCPKNKSSWAETRRSLVLGRGFNPEEMINGYHGNTLSSFDFPSDSEANLHAESKDPNLGLIFSNGLNMAHPSATTGKKPNSFQGPASPPYFYKPITPNGYNTLRSFSPSIISTNQQYCTTKASSNLINSPIMNNREGQNLVYPLYKPHHLQQGSNEMLFANLENLTTTFVNSNDSTATTTNEGKSGSNDTMTKLSDRHFELHT